MPAHVLPESRLHVRVAVMNSRWVEIHVYGARFLRRWFVWWDLWERRFCWETRKDVR
jgi:hypothetical protein